MTSSVLPVGDVEFRYTEAVSVGLHASNHSTSLLSDVDVQSSSEGPVTVTVKLALPTFPAESVAVQVTVDVPSGKKPKDHSLSQPPTCSVYPGSNEGSDQLKTHSRLPPESTLSVA